MRPGLSLLLLVGAHQALATSTHQQPSEPGSSAADTLTSSKLKSDAHQALSEQRPHAPTSSLSSSTDATARQGAAIQHMVVRAPPQSPFVQRRDVSLCAYFNALSLLAPHLRLQSSLPPRNFRCRRPRSVFVSGVHLCFGMNLPASSSSAKSCA